MLATIKAMLGSKKAVATLAGLIGTLGALLGVQVLIDLDPEQRLYAAGVATAFATWIINTYLKAQGQADQGKEAAKISAAATGAGSSD